MMRMTHLKFQLETVMYIRYRRTNSTTTRKGTTEVAREGAKVTFKPISDRPCVLKAKINLNYTICLVNAYAPTFLISEE